MKHASSLLLAAGLAAAQSTRVVKVLLPMMDPQEIVGSVISAGPKATAYEVKCPKGQDANDCGLPTDGLTVTYGPKTWEYTATIERQTLVLPLP